MTKTLADLEKEAIINAIKDFKGNLTEAAKELGIGRATLYGKMKRYELSAVEIRKQALKK